MKIFYENNKLILPEIKCSCGMEHQRPDLDVYIGNDLLKDIPSYLKERNLGKKVLVVADENTHRVAGEKVIKILQDGGFSVTLCLLERKEELEPDEAALGEVLLALESDTDFLIAVGSGSVTDTTRYVAFQTGRQFVSVATAASMDGYTSVVAPLLNKGLKVNKPASYPKVIICDLDIIKEAPYKMVISGFGDVLGKYIAKADWILGRIINDEQYCPVAAEMVSQAVQKCLDNLDGIRERTDEGMKSLIEALILSGLTILIIGYTRSVASNEHNMAHYWEMMKLLRGEKAARHGTAVGVATGYVFKFFDLFLQRDWSKIEPEQIRKNRLSKEEWEKRVLAAYGEKLGRLILRDNPEEYLDWAEQERRLNALVEKEEQIKEELSFLPKYEEIMEILKKIGSPLTAEEIGIDQQTLVNSLLYAKEYRYRYSVFKTVNEAGMLEEFVKQVLA